MTKSGIQKRLNTNARCMDQLTQILNQCRESGHQPHPTSDHGKLMAKISTTLAIRRRKRPIIPTPDEIIQLITEIKSFPTAQRFEIQQNIHNAEISAAATHREFNARLAHIMRIFPRVKLVRAIFGDKKYNELVMAPHDDFATKIYSEYMNNAISLVTHGTHYNARYMDMLLKYAGINVTDRDIAKIKRTYQKSGVNNDYTPDADNLNMDDVSMLYNISVGYARQVIGKYGRRILNANKNIYTSIIMLDAYIANDIDKMISLLPINMQKTYRFQQKYKLTQIPTEQLNTAGATLAQMSPHMKNKTAFDIIHRISGITESQLNTAGKWIYEQFGNIR